MRGPSLGVLVGVSAVLHLAGLGSAGLWLGKSDIVTAEKASIRIALGSRGARAGAEVQPQQLEAPEHLPEPERRPEPEPEAIPLPKPRPEAPLPPEPIIPVNSASRLQPNRQPETARPEPQSQTHPGQTEGERGQVGVGSDQELDTDGDTSDPGYQALLDSHDALVLGHLSRFKRFPPRARMRGEEGEVSVEFEISRDGLLLNYELKTSSGSRILDKAALEQVQKAEPYPIAPADAVWRTRTYRTTMRYSLQN